MFLSVKVECYSISLILLTTDLKPIFTATIITAATYDRVSPYTSLSSTKLYIKANSTKVRHAIKKESV